MNNVWIAEQGTFLHRHCLIFHLFLFFCFMSKRKFVDAIEHIPEGDLIEKLVDKVVKLTASLEDEIALSDDLQAQHENFRKMASCKIEDLRRELYEVRQFLRFKKAWEGKRDLYLTAAQGIGKGLLRTGERLPNVESFFNLDALGNFDLIDWFCKIAKYLHVVEYASDENEPRRWILTFPDTSALFSNDSDDASSLVFLLTSAVRPGDPDNAWIWKDLVALYNAVSSCLAMMYSTYISPVAALLQLHFENKCDAKSTELLHGLLSGSKAPSTLYSRITQFVTRHGHMEREVFQRRGDVMVTADNISQNYKPTFSENVKGINTPSIATAINVIELQNVDPSKAFLQYQWRLAPTNWKPFANCRAETITCSSAQRKLFEDSKFKLLDNLQELSDQQFLSRTVQDASAHSVVANDDYRFSRTKAKEVVAITSKVCPQCGAQWPSTRRLCACVSAETNKRTPLCTQEKAGECRTFIRPRQPCTIDRGGGIRFAAADLTKCGTKTVRLLDAEYEKAQQNQKQRSMYIAEDEMGNSAHVHVTPGLLINPASHSSTDQFQSVLAHYLSFVGSDVCANFVVPGQSSLRLYAFVRTDAGFRTDLLKYCGFLPHPEHNPHD